MIDFFQAWADKPVQRLLTGSSAAVLDADQRLLTSRGSLGRSERVFGSGAQRKVREEIGASGFCPTAVTDSGQSAGDGKQTFRDAVPGSVR